MKKIVSFLFCLLCCQIIAAQRVCYSDGSITIEGDPMTWTLATGGTHYPWVTSQYQWGKTCMTHRCTRRVNALSLPR